MAKNPVVMGKEEPEKPFVCGTYEGTGESAAQHIALGFRPSAVLVEYGQGIRMPQRAYPDNSSYGGLALDGVPAYGCVLAPGTALVEITDDGFTVRSTCNVVPANQHPSVFYRYLAFR